MMLSVVAQDLTLCMTTCVIMHICSDALLCTCPHVVISLSTCILTNVMFPNCSALFGHRLGVHECIHYMCVALFVSA